MKIHFDWILARFIDDNCEIVDEIEWDGRITPSTIARRLGKIQSGRLLPEVSTLVERFPDAEIDKMRAINDPDWPQHDDEKDVFQMATVELAKMKVADSSGDIDRRLDMLVSSAVELRASWTTSEARLSLIHI